MIFWPLFLLYFPLIVLFAGPLAFLTGLSGFALFLDLFFFEFLVDIMFLSMLMSFGRVFLSSVLYFMAASSITKWIMGARAQRSLGGDLFFPVLLASILFQLVLPLWATLPLVFLPQLLDPLVQTREVRNVDIPTSAGIWHQQIAVVSVKHSLEWKTRVLTIVMAVALIMALDYRMNDGVTHFMRATGRA
eukprot:comp17203_c0_seq1/m.28626 comp17203_c0_seq1/g.28626  ORF comp17203_c0_seq1/g.28626 comp17203_c0_seq1/m.28626 type:complete len:190 (-) comp17203_c0_seq1:57-626(-)